MVDSDTSYPTKNMTVEEWQAFWAYLIHDYSIFDFVGKHGHDNVAQHLEWKRQDYFQWRINYDAYIEPPMIRTKEELIQAFHNGDITEEAYKFKVRFYDSSPTTKNDEENKNG